VAPLVCIPAALGGLTVWLYNNKITLLGYGSPAGGSYLTLLTPNRSRNASQKLLAVLGTNSTCPILIKGLGFHAPLTHHLYQEVKMIEQTLQSGYRNYGWPGKKTCTVASVALGITNSITYPSPRAQTGRCAGVCVWYCSILSLKLSWWCSF